MELNRTGRYVMYLRKSRKDDEYGAASNEDVLARHEQLLRDTAKRNKIIVSEIYREVRSGDSISARPMMQQLLSELADGRWDGVLVVEIERLARGDTIDQGIVARAFQDSGAMIITPIKIYDPNDEYDEEYFEFGLFMSRREYKTIKRRMQRGRVAASKEGKFCGNKTPYGYKREKLSGESGFQLVPDPEEAEVIRKIYDWYVNGIPQPSGSRTMAGMAAIAHQLTAEGYAPRFTSVWSHNTVSDLLKNPVYIGKITWGKNKAIDCLQEDGTLRFRDHRQSSVNIFDGRHEPLITEDLYFAAQRRRHSSPHSHTHYVADCSNALTGLIRCKYCGRNLFYRKASARSPKDIMLCGNHECLNIGCFYDVLEARIIDAIRMYADQNSKPVKKPKHDGSLQTSINRIQKELDASATQLDRIYTAYERGVYADDVFLERSSSVKKKISDLQRTLKDLQDREAKQKQADQEQVEMIPKMRHLVETYWTLSTPSDRNAALKEVIDHIEYEKHKKSPKGGPFDNFSLVIYPRLFSSPFYFNN